MSPFLELLWELVQDVLICRLKQQSIKACESNYIHLFKGVKLSVLNSEFKMKIFAYLHSICCSNCVYFPKLIQFILWTNAHEMLLIIQCRVFICGLKLKHHLWIF